MHRYSYIRKLVWQTKVLLVKARSHILHVESQGLIRPHKVHARHFENTRKADRRKSPTSARAIIMSGQPDCVNQTAAAARNTEIFEAMSLREHSQTELIFTSSVL